MNELVVATMSIHSMSTDGLPVSGVATMGDLILPETVHLNGVTRLSEMTISEKASMNEVVVERLQTEVGVSINGLVGVSMQADRLVGDGVDVSGVGTMNRLLGNSIRILGGFNPDRLEVEEGATLNELVVRDGLGVGLTATITGLVGNGVSVGNGMVVDGEVSGVATMGDLILPEIVYLNGVTRLSEMTISEKASMKEVVVERLQTEVGVSINGLVGAGMQVVS